MPKEEKKTANEWASDFADILLNILSKRIREKKIILHMTPQDLADYVTAADDYDSDKIMEIMGRPGVFEADGKIWFPKK